MVKTRPRLTDEEQVDLIIEYHDYTIDEHRKAELRHLFCLSMFGYAHFIVRRYYKSTTHYDDIMQECYICLQQTLDELQIKFVNENYNWRWFVSRRLGNCVKEYLSQFALPYAVSRATFESSFKFYNAVEKIIHNKQSYPTAEEIAEEIGVQTYRQGEQYFIEENTKRPTNLIQSETNINLQERRGLLNDPVDQAEYEELKEILLEAIESLKPTHQHIIMFRYGFQENPQNMTEIADDLSMSKQRVRILCKEAHQQILSYIRKHYEEYYDIIKEITGFQLY